jgi:uncharacterized NAD-dependent epimerase/dehydratase family protein
MGTMCVGDHAGIGPGTRFLVLAEGLFADVHGKLAHGVLRFRPESAAAVIDSASAGRRADEIVPHVAPVPVVGSLEEGLALGPSTLLLGATPAGGAIPSGWRPQILEAIDAGLDIVAGMHVFLSDDP